MVLGRRCGIWGRSCRDFSRNSRAGGTLVPGRTGPKHRALVGRRRRGASCIPVGSGDCCGVRRTRTGHVGLSRPVLWRCVDGPTRRHPASNRAVGGSETRVVRTILNLTAGQCRGDPVGRPWGTAHVRSPRWGTCGWCARRCRGDLRRWNRRCQARGGMTDDVDPQRSHDDRTDPHPALGAGLSLPGRGVFSLPCNCEVQTVTPSHQATSTPLPRPG